MAITLYFQIKKGWITEVVDIVAAFLEGRIKKRIYVQLPEGLMDLGFLTKEEEDKLCIELLGGMYGNVNAALLFFERLQNYIIGENGLNMNQSKTDCFIRRTTTEN